MDLAHPPFVSQDEDQQRTRIAWLYYVEGQTQAEIAENLGLSRARVNRELALSREQGLVQIRVNSKLTSCIQLERRLIATFSLQDAVVVPTPADPDTLPSVIGLVAGAYVSDRLDHGMSVGVAWGRTLLRSLRAIERRPLRDLSVVSLMGGLTRAAAVNTYETAARFADLFGAECYYLAAPTFASSPASRRTILEQEAIGDVMERARKVDMAIVSVGDLAPNTPMRRLSLLNDDDAETLLAAGAVGDLVGHFIDRDGRVVDHPLNERVVGVSPADLARIPIVILASGAPGKVGVIRGALAGHYVSRIITDEMTAAALLE